MPRYKETVRTATMFVYCSPRAKAFAKRRAKKKGINYSIYVNDLLEREQKKLEYGRRAA